MIVVLIRDGFNKEEQPYYHCLVGESRDAPGQLVGYCLYFYTYFTLVGRCVYMEDLYVSPSFRGKGLGKALWQTLVKVCELFLVKWDDGC